MSNGVTSAFSRGCGPHVLRSDFLGEHSCAPPLQKHQSWMCYRSREAMGDGSMAACLAVDAVQVLQRRGTAPQEPLWQFSATARASCRAHLARPLSIRSLNSRHFTHEMHLRALSGRSSNTSKYSRAFQLCFMPLTFFPLGVCP